MSEPSQLSIWALVAEASATLPEPFSRAALISWIEQRRPDVETSSISTHIQYAVAGIPNRDIHPLGRREPLLERIGRGLYRRYRGPDRRVAVDVPAGTSAAAPVPAPTKMPLPPVGAVPRVILVGCSSRKSDGPAQARDLFRGTGFQKARDRALRMQLPWFALSAKYGLLHPDDVVGPYDVFLGDQPSTYRSAWGEWVAAQLSARLPLGGVTVEVHAGEAYCLPLRIPFERFGARLSEPLAGLNQGQRLAWSGYGGIEAVERLEAAVTAPDLAPLLDPAAAVTPAAFLTAGSAGRQTPGLYTWWVDEDGARDLSAGLGHPVAAGLLYAGKAGGHRKAAAPSTSTLWSRVSGNHLRGNIGSSTFRRSLAALLAAAGKPLPEEELTGWMHVHLRVSVLPVDIELVAALEGDLVARANPPLNLAGTPTQPARSALTRLRGLLSRPSPASGQDEGDSEVPAVDSGSREDSVRGFERRVRSDLSAIIAAGYRPTIFQRMLAESGAVGTAQRLLAASTMSDGFRYLWEHGLLQLSVECAVLADDFAELFSDDEKEVARRRLVDAGYL